MDTEVLSPTEDIAHSSDNAINTIVNSNENSYILIPDDVWNQRIQDEGCAQDALPSSHYQRNKIISVGSEKDKRFYFHLTAIAVDFAKIMKESKDMNTGWDKIPKNNTQIKEKIVERLLSLRTKEEGGKYVLDQKRVVQMLETFWGSKAVDTTPHVNDRLRLFGILMTNIEFRPMLQRLSDGVVNREQLDNPELSLKQMFMNLALAFNNEEVVITLPDDAFDLENSEMLDPNDRGRISINRDCKYICLKIINFFTIILLLFYYSTITFRCLDETYLGDNIGSLQRCFDSMEQGHRRWLRSSKRI